MNGGVNRMISDFFVFSSAQKVLRFLLLNYDKFCYEREIARGAKVSYGSANSVLVQLYKAGIVIRKSEGRMSYYMVNLKNSYLRELKIFTSMLVLEPLVEKLKEYVHKIILFGSCARGEDTFESDVDLFILTSEKDNVRDLVEQFSQKNNLFNRKIQAIIESPADFLKKDNKGKIFMQQVNQGKLLWQRGEDADNF